MNPILTFFAGYLIAQMRPRACAACGGAMVPVTDASDLPIPQRLALEVNQAIGMGGEFLLEKARGRAVLWFKDEAGALFEVAPLDPAKVAAMATASPAPPIDIGGPSPPTVC